MNNIFNGQINISRDLRKNKPVVIGKYDLVDIVFLTVGIGIAIIIAYIFGFSLFRLVDEFVAILIGIIPMLIIISIGFRRVAGMRYFNYIRMKHIDKKTKTRLNRRIDKNQIGDKYLIPVEIDIDKVEKYKNIFLNYENVKRLQIRYDKDLVCQNKARVIIDLRYTKKEFILKDIVDKFLLNKEIESITSERLKELEDNLNRRFINDKVRKNNKKVKYKNARNENKNIKMNDNQYIANIKSNINYLFHRDKDIVKKYKYVDYNIQKKYIIYMLNIYDTNNYNNFIDKIKEEAEVVSYYKKYNDKIYVNTFLILEDDIIKINKLDKICEEYKVIVDKLSKEQMSGKMAVLYIMFNPFNAYRICA